MFPGAIEPAGFGKLLFRRAVGTLQRGKKDEQMASKFIGRCCAITSEGEKLLENAVTRLGLSARAHDRILKVARTIADLEAAADILPKHLSEAIQYRTLDRNYWS